MNSSELRPSLETAVIAACFLIVTACIADPAPPEFRLGVGRGINGLELYYRFCDDDVLTRVQLSRIGPDGEKGEVLWRATKADDAQGTHEGRLAIGEAPPGWATDVQLTEAPTGGHLFASFWINDRHRDVGIHVRPDEIGVGSVHGFGGENVTVDAFTESPPGCFDS